MFVKGLRKFLYAGALLALAPVMARAEDKAPATPAAPAATTCKVRVCEMVSEPFEYTRTVYKKVAREEVYTAYRCETVMEQKTVNYTEYKKVCETVMETRCVTKRVPCWEERVEYVTRWKLEKVTEMKERTVRGGHWECCEVPAGGLFHKSCDPCATRTVKKWVPECHKECVPVCRTKLVKVCEPVCRKVCTYKCVTEQVTCPVTRVKCVLENKTTTVNVCKKVMVPYQAKRTVCECVPVNEVVKGTRCVPRWVEKEVACCNPCDPCATTSCCGRDWFGKVRGKLTVGKRSSCCAPAACGAAAACCN